MESNPSPSPNPRSVTVISGRSSFIGRSLVAALLSSSSGGDLTVRIADPHLPPSDHQPGRILHFHTHFEDPSQLRTAIEGSSAVFLVDTTLGAPPPPATADGFLTSYKAVVEEARNVVRACRECGVERLVYTGSADVVFDGMRDVVDGDESLPYPDEFMDVLNELRAQAEMMVLDANGRDGLSTCVLRTSNPFGPGDDHFVPMLVAKAKSAWAKVFRIFICSQSKYVHLLEPPPATTNHTYTAGVSTDCCVMTWFLNMEEMISSNVMFLIMLRRCVTY